MQGVVLFLSCVLSVLPSTDLSALAFTHPCWWTQVIANGATLLASLGSLIVMVGFKVTHSFYGIALEGT